MNALIAAQNITVIRQGKAILDNVSLAIGTHDFVTVIGPNGAGKSMLLKCLMGFYEPDAGQVVTHKSLRIGYVPQRLLVDQSMPVTVGRFLTLRKKASRDTVAKVAVETHITDILDKPLSVLSGGELQRVLLARSLLDDPQLLVLDEPAQNLDISGQLAFYKLLEEIYAQRDVSILMISHDLHMVMASTKKVVCLYHHICCSGEPHVVTQDPEFISLFGNDMAKMMAVYQHSHNHDHRHDDGDHEGCDHE
jgi:zinc transport system ATP-binding protein